MKNSQRKKDESFPLGNHLGTRNRLVENNLQGVRTNLADSHADKELKEFWKITELKKCLLLLDDGDRIDLDEKYYTKKKIELMQEAEKYGRKQGQLASQERCLNLQKQLDYLIQQGTRLIIGEGYGLEIDTEDYDYLVKEWEEIIKEINNQKPKQIGIGTTTSDTLRGSNELTKKVTEGKE